jgi:hypothetical protein
MQEERTSKICYKWKMVIEKKVGRGRRDLKMNLEFGDEVGSRAESAQKNEHSRMSVYIFGDTESGNMLLRI